MKSHGWIVLACLMLAACSEKKIPAPQAPVAAQPAQVPAAALAVAKPAAEDQVAVLLMQAVYGDKYRPARGDALVDLPDPDKPGETLPCVVTAVAHTVLPSGETVLIANGEMAGADGTAQSGHGSPGLVNVYLLRQTDGKWQVIKRHENIASLGSMGQMGTVEWVKLAEDKTGMAVLHGGTWQGYTVELLTLFDLSAEHVKGLSNISIHSDSEGGCDKEGEGTCWSVTGKWRLVPAKHGAVYPDIVIDFGGERSTREPAEEGQPMRPRIAKKISGSARYVFDGDQYKLAEGENLVPDV